MAVLLSVPNETEINQLPRRIIASAGNHQDTDLVCKLVNLLG